MDNNATHVWWASYMDAACTVLRDPESSWRAEVTPLGSCYGSGGRSFRYTLAKNVAAMTVTFFADPNCSRALSVATSQVPVGLCWRHNSTADVRTECLSDRRVRSMVYSSSDGSCLGQSIGVEREFPLGECTLGTDDPNFKIYARFVSECPEDFLLP